MDRPASASRSAPDALLATIGGSQRERFEYDIESGLLVAALDRRGVRAEIVPWDAPVDWARSPLVVVRTPWDYTERHGEFMAWVHETAAATTLVNDASVIAWNTHKGYLVQLARAGVPVVPTSLLERGCAEASRQTALAAHGEQVVIKPAISAGARGTILTRAASAQAAEHLAALTRAGDALVQPYLPAVEDGEVSLMYFGGVLSHAVRKLPAHGDFRVQEELGGSVLAQEATPAERAVAAAVLEAVPGTPLYARIDLVAGGGEPLLMEAELIEPEMFLNADATAAGRFADVLRARLDR
jgi:glutathione synthase/RimK-type ligase-like ATP-grasp enzyme